MTDPGARQTPLSSPPDASAGLGRPESRILRRVLVMLSVLCVVIAAAYFTPLKDYVRDLESLKSMLDKSGYAAPVIFTAGSAVLIGFGFSRLFLCFAAGVLFGFVVGFPVVLLGTMVGSYAAFLAVRWTGMHSAARKLTSFRWIKAILAQQSVLSVAFVRQVPISGIVLNVYLGSTHVSHETFLVGSLLGYVPSTLVAVLFGSGVAKGLTKDVLGSLQVVIAVATAIATAGALYIMRRRMIRRVSPAGADTAPLTNPPPTES